MSQLIETIAQAIQDKKGKNIVALDLSGFDGAVCPAFVICKVWRVEGLNNGVWVVMDYGDVLVHIFQTELRDFYKLDELWADAPATRYASEE